MRTLSVIGVEDGAILATDETGEHFRIPVDDTLRGRLAGASLPPGKKVSPREIQAHVRAGLSLEEVAARTGAPIAFVERFVRPVLAERAFVLESAMRVTVQPDAEADQPSRFGAVLAERLAALAATDVEWTSLKETGGDWIVSVSFRADDVDHRARWVFDPKRLVLSPENVEASTLSQQGTPTALTPRLRAVAATGPIGIVASAPDVAVADAGADEPEADEPDQSRFDSAIFELPDLSPAAREREQGPVEAAVLLDALARKRVEREAAAVEPVAPEDADEAVEEASAEPAQALAAVPPVVPSIVRAATDDEDAEAETDDPTGTDDEQPTAVLTDDVVPLRRPRDRAGRRPEPQRRQEAQQRPQAVQPVPRTAPAGRPADPEAAMPPSGGSSFQRSRRGRNSLPSWDEIVYGKGED